MKSWTQKFPSSKTRDWLKTKSPTILVILVVLLTILAVYQFVDLQRTKAELREVAGSLILILERSQQLEVQLGDTQAELSDTQASLASAQAHNQELQDEIAQISSEREQAAAQANLYQAQKYFESDVLNWLATRFGYTDLEDAALAYSAATGSQPPQSCEAENAERYSKWVSTGSTIFVASPKKMGWSPYVGWSVRENVVFGEEHFATPGYVGSRGYEFRYPLVPGTFPLQEVHTTINVYESNVPDNYFSDIGASQVVELNCGVTGQMTIASDVDETKTIYFALGGFAVNVKLKYFYADTAQSTEILKQAANVVIASLTAGW